MLGELYRPKGPALETAQQVLEIESPFACNVAYGCPNGCYDNRCYNYRRTKGRVRLPKVAPAAMVYSQLARGLRPEGVVLSFGTDPYLPQIVDSTRDLVRVLLSNDIRVATLTKLIPETWSTQIRFGMTLVSSDEKFRKQYEPKASPIKERISLLSIAQEHGAYIWVSMEPSPPPAIWKQDLRPLLEAVSFVDFIIFGKLNYDKRANTEEARLFYRATVAEFEDFCKAHGIRHWVKSDTRKFCEEAS